MSASLTFNPALTAQTRVPVAGDGPVHLRFTAAFGSRDACERARDGGVHVEMWTDLPVEGAAGEWHALRFRYVEDAVSPIEDKSGRVIALSPHGDALETPDAGRAVFLDLTLKDVHIGTSYSFTYRLVHASGHIEWLGAYGQNGALVFERRDDRLEWADGWTLNGNEATSEWTDDTEERLVAALNNEMKWTCWAFGEHGWPALSSAKEVPSSKTVILIPRKPSWSVVEPQPILLNVSGPGSIRIDETERIYSTGAISIIAHTLNEQNAWSLLQSALPETSQILQSASNDKYIVVASPSSEDVTFPIALSFIPFMSQEGSQELVLRGSDLKAIKDIVDSSDLVLTTLSKTTFCFMGPEQAEDVAVRLGPCGGQLLVSEMHALSSPHPSPWKFAMLSPTMSAQIEKAETSLALPTPPPSPPPTMDMPVMSRRSDSHDTTDSVETVVPVRIPSYQSFQSLAESFDSETETIAPLSPASINLKFREDQPDVAPIIDEQKPEPDMEVEHEQEELEEIEETEPSQQLTATSRPSLNDGFLRFFFAWLLRALLARVWGIVDTGFRWFGLPPPFRLGHGAGPQRPGVGIGSVIAQKVCEPSSAMIQEVVYREESASLMTIDEEPEQDIVEDDDEQEEAQEPETNVTVAQVRQPVPVPAPIPVVPSESHPSASLVTAAVRRHKARFLADVRSNIVSFLVHAPHAHAPLSELAISINEKRVEGGQGYSCAQLAGDVYLLGLQGPEGGSKVEIALD
ncbi:hypothetical protein EIP86_000165 [Pleurotus ostreatoroseus]|nr:hypothetical protein EIP86_000165 [Pleurotus ostreatoroseus]